MRLPYVSDQEYPRLTADECVALFPFHSCSVPFTPSRGFCQPVARFKVIVARVSPAHPSQLVRPRLTLTIPHNYGKHRVPAFPTYLARQTYLFTFVRSSPLFLPAQYSMSDPPKINSLALIFLYYFGVERSLPGVDRANTCQKLPSERYPIPFHFATHLLLPLQENWFLDPNWLCAFSTLIGRLSLLWTGRPSTFVFAPTDLRVLAK